jgi:hypothetical protein
MTKGGLIVAAFTAVLFGCSGRLEFDPQLLDAGAGQIGQNLGSGGKGGGNGNQGMGGNTGGSGGETPYPPAQPPPPPDAQAWGMPDGGTGTGGSGAVARDSGVTPPPDAAPAAPACPTGFNVLDAVFNKKCGGCHSATAPAKNLDLVTAGIGTRTVNKPSTCGTKPLLSTTLGPGNTPTGLLIEKLLGPVTGCGVQMPAGAPPLSATEMACVNEWAIGAINKALGR